MVLALVEHVNEDDTKGRSIHSFRKDQPVSIAEEQLALALLGKAVYAIVVAVPFLQAQPKLYYVL